MTSFERDAFARLSQGRDKVTKKHLLESIEELGFKTDTDIRLVSLKSLADQVSFGDALALLHIPLLKRILHSEISLADWTNLKSLLTAAYDEAFESCANSGVNATYIEPLKEVPSTLRGAAVCTIDGQCWSKGDSLFPFTIQSVSKTVNYCIALETLGLEKVLSFVDVEPSGTFFNDLVLLPGGIPFVA